MEDRETVDPGSAGTACYADSFLRDGGTIELSWDRDSESVKIEAHGYGKTARRLCELFIPDGWPVTRKELFMRDIEACVKALIDYKPHEWCANASCKMCSERLEATK